MAVHVDIGGSGLVCLDRRCSFTARLVVWRDATVGARLRRLRKSRNLSQQRLADLAGLSQSFVSQVERDQMMLDRRSHIAGLARALRVSDTEIIDVSPLHYCVHHCADRLVLYKRQGHEVSYSDTARTLLQTQGRQVVVQ